MDLVFKIVDNTPQGHPILLENIKGFFPDATMDNLPPGYLKFEKIELSKTRYQEFIETSYHIVGNVVKNGYLRDLTDDEKTKVDLYISEALRFQTASIGAEAAQEWYDGIDWDKELNGLPNDPTQYDR